jgi:hypothetical protein
MEDNRIFSFDILKKIPLNVPSLLGVSYFFGFLIVRSYLNKFNFHAVSLLNTDYLAVGTLFSIIFGGLFLSIYYLKKDNEEISLKNQVFILHAVLRVLIIIYVTTFFTTIYSSENYLHRILNGAGYSILLLSLFLRNKKFSKGLSWKEISWSFIVFLAIINTVIYCCFPTSRALMLQLFFAGFGIILIISDTFSKKFFKVQAVGIIFIAISFATTFGQYVYGNIPRQFGGAQPYSLNEIFFKPDYVKEIGKSTFSLGSIYCSVPMTEV